MMADISIQQQAETDPTLSFNSDRQDTDREEVYLDGSLVLVGCGKAKRDPEDPVDLHEAVVGPEERMGDLPQSDTGPAWQARDLYTSSYFATKRDFADLVTRWASGYNAGQWAVLSAEHDVVPHHRKLKYYDKSVDDIGDDPTNPDHCVDNQFGRRRPDGQPIVTEMDQWAANVAASLAKWLSGFRDERGRGDPCDIDATELIVLAGQDYIDPLRDRGVFEYGIARMGSDPNSGFKLPVEPRYLFEEIPAGGNFEQMAWLSEAASKLEPLVGDLDDSEQTTLADGGSDIVGKEDENVN